MEVISFSNIGKRENNEDFILVKDNVFIVCDGVGGVNKGEVVSEFVATNFYNLIATLEITDTNLNSVIFEIQNKLKLLVEGKVEDIGMGTTLASLLSNNGIFYTCHIGDSRIYHFRTNIGEFYRTRDHSLVEELIVSNHITEEEAQTHPKKHVIIKALIADPNRENDSATINKIEEVSEGDIFLICSDGITEAWDEKHLVELFLNTSSSLEEISEELQNQCNAFSNDNNSAILVKVQRGDIIESKNIEHQTSSTIQEIESKYSTYNKNGKFNFLRILIPIIIIASVTSFFIFNNQSKNSYQPNLIQEPKKKNDIRNMRIERETNNQTIPKENLYNDNAEKKRDYANDIVAKLRKAEHLPSGKPSNPKAGKTKDTIDKARKNNPTIYVEQNETKRPSEKNKDSMTQKPTNDVPENNIK